MTEPTIICPNCRNEVKLTESLAAPLLESMRHQYEQKIANKEEEILKREKFLQQQQNVLNQEKASIDDQVTAKLKSAREKIVAEEAQKARLILSTEIEEKGKEILELQEVLKARDTKLAAAQKDQAELLRKQRELEDAKREIDLTIEKRVQESLGTVRDQAKKEAEEALKLKVAEKEQTITSMQHQIEELKRRAEQGSQQLQGEVQELELESILRAKFPQDIFEPVPKGEHGGDLVHKVINAQGQHCGTILWEAKRTKNWSDGWLSKLRDDQRAAKAEIALMISQTLPKGTNVFDLIEGVWVAEPRCAIPIAITLRHSLMEIASTRQISEGQQTKMELVYQYLTGSSFRHRIEAIVEKFSDMHADLDTERKTMTRLWAKRDKQIQGVIEATAGMYGDLQGIAGKSLQEIEGLNIKLLENEA